MKPIIFTALCLLSITAYTQVISQKPDFNFGFEQHTYGQKLADKWMQWGVGYLLNPDSTEKFEGKYSLSIKAPAGKKINTFGCAVNSIPAVWSGKEIELRGYMKFKDVKDGFVGLMLRIDGQDRPLQFSNMQKENIAGSAEWKEYSLKLPYPNDAKTIHLGAIITGSGQLWVDKFEVFLDGMKLSDASYKELVKAEKDKEFDTGSRITFKKLTDAEIKELAELGQIWGFLKYHHPAVAAGNYNWDYELFRILPKYQSAQNQLEKYEVILNWIDSLGTFTERKEDYQPGNDIAMKPDLAWIKSPGFGEKLQTSLLKIKNAERSGKHYYIGSYENIGNPEFKNEKSYRTMNYPDAGFRLLALFRYWNMIQYYFPYKDLIDGNWNSVLTEFIPQFINAPDETQYRLTTLRLIARISDTHANIWNDPVLNKHFGEKNAVPEVSFIENKAVITGFHDKSLGQNCGLKKGDILEKINGKAITLIIKESLPVTPASNVPTQLRNIAGKLLRTNDSLITVDYRRGKQSGKVVLLSYDQARMPIVSKAQRKDTCFKLIRNDIAYLYPGSIHNSYLPEITPKILKSKGLIIDFRCYPSDFLVYTFANSLLPSPAPFVKFSATDTNEPGLFKFTPALSTGKENPDYFKGQVVILINEITQSSAEFTTMAFRTAPNVKVIGSTTAGADGDVSAITLPGNIITYISGLGVYYPDGKGTQRIGIVPDIEVNPTIKGIIEGRDELMEKAIEIIDKQ